MTRDQNLPHTCLKISNKIALVVHHEIVARCLRQYISENINSCCGSKYKTGKEKQIYSRVGVKGV